MTEEATPEVETDADETTADDAAVWQTLTADQLRTGMYLQVRSGKDGSEQVPLVYEVTSVERSGAKRQVYCRHLESGNVGVVELAEGQRVRAAGADRAKAMAKAKRERPQAVAASKGAWAGHPACADLWKLSKRELLEAALHCASMSTDNYGEGGAEQAAKALRAEIATLRENEMI